MIEDISLLRTVMLNKLQHTTTTFHRYLYSQIDWSNILIGIKGYRGVGKTTLMLQHIKESFSDLTPVLYASVDNGWFQTNTIYDLAAYHYQHGGTHLFLDEIHKYPNWQSALKNIYDDLPGLHVVFTGSSMLQISAHEGDLSRRMRMYTMQVMSFREYIAIETGVVYPTHTLDDILSNHINIAANILIDNKILPLFEKYLQHGCYPFYQEDILGFSERLQQTIWQVLESDWPSVDDTVTYATIQKTKRLLMVLSECVPLMPKMTELFAAIETNRDGGLRMLAVLEKAGLLSLCTYEPRNIGVLRKPDKIYLGNTNLMYALSQHTDIGTLRETFFYNQLIASGHEVLLAKQGDFTVNRKIVFEVGGAGKTFKQLSGIEFGYLAIDNIEVGDGHRVPLWMFGFMY